MNQCSYIKGHRFSGLQGKTLVLDLQRSSTHMNAYKIAQKLYLFIFSDKNIFPGQNSLASMFQKVGNNSSNLTKYIFDPESYILGTLWLYPLKQLRFLTSTYSFISSHIWPFLRVPFFKCRNSQLFCRIGWFSLVAFSFAVGTVIICTYFFFVKTTYVSIAWSTDGCSEIFYLLFVYVRNQIQYLVYRNNMHVYLP